MLQTEPMFVTLYVGNTVASAHILAASADPELVALVKTRLLAQNKIILPPKMQNCQQTGRRLRRRRME